MPSGNHKQAVETFCEDTAIIGELLTKYKDHTVLIAGDLNADILHRTGKKENAIIDLIRESDLTCLNKDLTGTFTYYYPALGHSSHLDYFITNNNLTWTATSILPKDSQINSLNCSTHLPITTRCILNGAKEDDTRKSHPAPRPNRARVEDIDILLYQDLLTHELSQIDFSLLTPNDSIKLCTMAISTATVGASQKPPKPKSSTRRKGTRPWTKSIQEAAKFSKIAFWSWKEAGRPGPTDSRTLQKRSAAKALRTAQRQEEARRRTLFLNQVMEAQETDCKTFHRLIKRNRGSCSQVTALKKGDSLVFDQSEQKGMWADYFEKLSCSHHSTGDADKATTTELIRLTNFSKPGTHVKLTAYDIEQAIKKLNRNKSPDQDNVTAEHLQRAPLELLTVITNVINEVFETGTCPDACKTGFKIPIPKKQKDPTLQTNYRGITIAALVGKVVEHLLANITDPLLQSQASSLQFGFTSGLSPSMATLYLTETIATAKDEKRELFVSTLDAQKAFDVVNHSLLKQKAHTAGIIGNQWNLLDSLYSNLHETVRWNGEFSRKFEVTQGVRQGAVLSTSLYKLYIDQLLHSLKSSDIGMHIGTIYAGSPTCADDMLLISENKENLQAMLDLCFSYSKDHKYVLHPEKSSVTPLITKNPPEAPWKLGEDPMPTTTTFTHLGLNWDANKTSPDIMCRIQVARRTSYALMGVGVHGRNGLSPATSAHITKIYVLPRLLHGLEATVLARKQRSDLTNYHRNLLRHIQGLPTNTASEAVYLLLGELPLEAELDKRIFNLYGAVCRAEENSSLQELATRQLAVDNKSSWFQQLTQLSVQYDIDIHGPRHVPWRKRTWKEYTHTVINNYWFQKLLEGILDKTSTRYIDLQHCEHGPHPVWTSCTLDASLVQAATVRSKLLTNTYLTQHRIAKFSKTSPDPTCQLCRRTPEDIPHFLLICPSLTQIRAPRLRNLQQLGFSIVDLQPTDATRTLLNGPPMMSESARRINVAITKLCHSLHHERNRLLNIN